MLALLALVSACMALFGVATYRLYARSQFQHLDDDLRATVPFATSDLAQAAGPILGARLVGPRSGPGGRGTSGPSADGGRPPPPLSTYAELRDSSGAVIARRKSIDYSAQPRLANRLVAHGDHPLRFAAPSITGPGEWRVYVAPCLRLPGDTVLVAAPMSGVTRPLHELGVIEVAGAAVLLAILSAAGWLLIRRGLRPLELIADTAHSISSGDLTQRVAIFGVPGEVGQLGLALNKMLDTIEAAFRERDATEQRLRQFLADASHELRTPLTSILGFAGLFRMGTGGDRSDLATILRRIEQESTRMKVLIEDLLLLADLDDAKSPVERTLVDLAVLTADVCREASPDGHDHPITLDAPDQVVVAGNPSHLRMAIAHLVTNAVRHTPPTTSIEVSVRAEHNTATVAVRDRGPGLDNDALAHAFDRFWQADKARVGAGVGLGLSIVAAIAAEHGGTATATNAHEGGALSLLRLPGKIAAPRREYLKVDSTDGCVRSG
jgi:two-component system, OmpR family, sensor kinase